MSTKIISTNVEIMGKPYPVRCPEGELPALQQAARFLDQKMCDVRDSGKAINLERIAIITALNMAYELLQSGQQKNTFVDKINQYILNLQEKLDHAILPAQADML
jgi:cell division protein ZapA